MSTLTRAAFDTPDTMLKKLFIQTRWVDSATLYPTVAAQTYIDTTSIAGAWNVASNASNFIEATDYVSTSAVGVPMIRVDTTDAGNQDIDLTGAGGLDAGGWDLSAVLNNSAVESVMIAITETDWSHYYPGTASGPVYGLMFAGIAGAGDVTTATWTRLYLFDSHAPTSMPAPFAAPAVVQLFVRQLEMVELGDIRVDALIGPFDWGKRAAELGPGIGFNDLKEGLQSLIDGDELYYLGAGDGSTVEFVVKAAAASSDELPILGVAATPDMVKVYVGGVLQVNPYDQDASGTALGSQTAAGTPATASPYKFGAPGGSYGTPGTADWDETDTGTTTNGVAIFFVDAPPNGAKVMAGYPARGSSTVL